MSQAAERIRSQLRYADHYRQQARAADSLGGLLEHVTPGTIHDVVVKGPRWFRRHRNRTEEVVEIVLSDDERHEFAQWCKERAAKLRKQADETEARLTNV
jgi:hypothetical protein